MAENALWKHLWFQWFHWSVDQVKIWGQWKTCSRWFRYISTILPSKYEEGRWMSARYKRTCHYYSMTQGTKTWSLNPKNRRRRIAAGSGNTFVKVNKFIRFNQAKQLMQCHVWGYCQERMSRHWSGPNNLQKICQIWEGMDYVCRGDKVDATSYVRSRRTSMEYEPDVCVADSKISGYHETVDVYCSIKWKSEEKT